MQVVSQSPDRSEGQAEGVSPPALQRPENFCCAGGSQSLDSPEGQAEGVSPPALQRPENLCCAGGSQSPDRSEGQAEGVKPPAFQTGPRTYREEVGSTALLLCKVNNLGKFYT